MESERHIAFATDESLHGGPTALELVEIGGCFLVREYEMDGDDAGQRHVLSASYKPAQAFRSWEKWTGDPYPAWEHSRGRL